MSIEYHIVLNHLLFLINLNQDNFVLHLHLEYYQYYIYEIQIHLDDLLLTNNDKYIKHKACSFFSKFITYNNRN